MEEAVFLSQIRRLKSEFGQKAYGEERQKLMWQMFKNELDEYFMDATNYLIANSRRTPVAEDFEKAIETRKRRGCGRTGQPQSVNEILGDMWSKNTKSEMSDNAKERVKARLQLLRDLQPKKLTNAQFLEGCDFYDAEMKKENPQEGKCHECDNTGLTYRNETYFGMSARIVFRCYCKYGDKHDSQIYKITESNAMTAR